MKKVFFIYIILLLIPGFLMAASFTIGTDLEATIESATALWTNVFSSAGVNILYGLAVIELVITFGFMAIKGELEFTGIMFAFIRMILIIGFFLFLMGNSGTDALTSIIDSFKQLGADASGQGISADNIFTKIGTLYTKLLGGLSLSITSLIVAGIGVLVVYILIGVGVRMLTALTFATLSIYAAALFFAFGVFAQTRAWAINALTNSVRYGARYMAILLLIGIAFSFVEKMISLLDKDTVGTGELFSLLIFALLLKSLAEGIEDFIDGYITGLGGGSNFAAGQMLKQIASNTAITARNAAQGAKGGGFAAINKIKDANAAASAAGVSGVNKSGSVAGVAGGMMVGAMSGMARGATGFKTHSAGVYSGGKVADKVTKSTLEKVNNSSSNSTKKNEKQNTPTTEKINTPTPKEPNLKPGDRGFYHSSVPNQKDKK